MKSSSRRPSTNKVQTSNKKPSSASIKKHILKKLGLSRLPALRREVDLEARCKLCVPATQAWRTENDAVSIYQQETVCSVHQIA
eukprot:6461487-Amphidinium_carterae.3